MTIAIIVLYGTVQITYRLVRLLLEFSANTFYNLEICGRKPNGIVTAVQITLISRLIDIGLFDISLNSSQFICHLTKKEIHMTQKGTKPKYIRKIDKVDGLSAKEKVSLSKVADKFQFRANEYYLSLINFDDPKDPIRRIIIPDIDELTDWGTLDASFEDTYTKAPGLQHKYTPTALLLVNDTCGGFCRFCFRKRLFIGDNDEVVRDVSEGIKYIQKHTEITNVLLTGGDPLLLSTTKLENVIKKVREIDHVKIIRIGTKMPAFFPMRITQDPTLLEMLRKYRTREKNI